MLITSNAIVCINTSMDFWKLIYENFEKKPISNISTYAGHRHFEVLWSFIFYILWRFVFCLWKTVIMLTFLCICIKHSQHYEMRKNDSKLNCMKNHRVYWFSHGRIKSQNVLSHLPDWVSAEKARLHHCSCYLNLNH